jgi:hypothetical protein
MLYARFGRSIAEKFLIPYNEKLYACDLATLDRDAMGRFFPHADLTDIVRNMKAADNATYNATFTYPAGGAIEYVKAIASAVRPGPIALEEALVSIDLRRGWRAPRSARSASSAWCPRRPSEARCAMCGLAHDPSLHLEQGAGVQPGLRPQGPARRALGVLPRPATSFYRIGYYDNIFDTDRLSLYVELGYARDAAVDVEAMRARVLADLRARASSTTTSSSPSTPS